MGNKPDSLLSTSIDSKLFGAIVVLGSSQRTNATTAAARKELSSIESSSCTADAVSSCASIRAMSG